MNKAYAALAAVLLLGAPAWAQVPGGYPAGTPAPSTPPAATNPGASGAMGLPWVQVQNAVVLEDSVAVQVLATDQAPSEANGNGGADGTPGEEAAPGGADHVSPGQAGPHDQPPSPDHPGLSHL